jgi:hypothetical protein
MPNHSFSDMYDGDEWVVYDNAREDAIFLHVRASDDWRRVIRAQFKHLGSIRPAHALCKSHLN